jgi:hypothetical protein
MSAATHHGLERLHRSLMPCCLLAAIGCAGSASAFAQKLPDAPSALLGFALAMPQQSQTPLPPNVAAPSENAAPRPCMRDEESDAPSVPFLLRAPRSNEPCHRENPLQEIISARNSPPLTPELKGFLAIRNVADPFNLITVAGYSGIEIAADSHTAYGPGYAGWGRLAGYSLLEDMQSEFFGTFAIPSLVHEDPRYHRLPGASVKRRLGHALIHTVWTQHDDGTPMINYATLLTYPISAELGNLYVPGLSTNAPSTAKRIAAGYATDPVGPLIAEFLPDVAKHIHVRVVFVQQILQQVATHQQNAAQ